MSDRSLKYATPVAELPPGLLSEPDRFVRPGQVATLLGISVGTVYNLVRAGRLPAPRRLSHRVSGWRAADVAPFVRGESESLAGQV